MPKLSIELRASLPIPNQSFGSYTAGVNFADIDTDGDIDKQLDALVDVLGPASERAEQGLAQVLANVSGLAIEGTGLSKEFAEFRNKATDTIRKIVVRVRDHAETMDKVKEVLKDALAEVPTMAPATPPEQPATPTPAAPAAEAPAPAAAQAEAPASAAPAEAPAPAEAAPSAESAAPTPAAAKAKAKVEAAKPVTPAPAPAAGDGDFDSGALKPASEETSGA